MLHNVQCKHEVLSWVTDNTAGYVCTFCVAELCVSLTQWV